MYTKFKIYIFVFVLHLRVYKNTFMHNLSFIIQFLLHWPFQLNLISSLQNDLFVLLPLKNIHSFNLKEKERLNQAKCWRQEPNLGLPRGCQEPKYLSHHLLPSRICISSNQNQECNSSWKPGSHIWNMRVPADVLTMGPNACLYSHFQKGKLRLRRQYDLRPHHFEDGISSL